jgi:hypothetical protein
MKTKRFYTFDDSDGEIVVDLYDDDKQVGTVLCRMDNEEDACREAVRLGDLWVEGGPW